MRGRLAERRAAILPILSWERRYPALRVPKSDMPITRPTHLLALDSNWEPGPDDWEGKEAGWLFWAVWDTDGSPVWIGDAGFWGSEEDGLLVELPGGRYQIEGRVIDYGFEFRVAGIRAFLEGTGAEPGAKIGETWADTASHGICLAKSFQGTTEEEQEPVWEAAMARETTVATLTLPDGSPYFVTETGNGDGEFEVVELVAEGKRVGFQVTFLPVGTEHD